MNILLCATHASYFIPEHLKQNLTPEFKANNFRLLKNFSDFATAHLIPRQIPGSNKVLVHFSRALGDPNRSKNAPDLFRETDFNNNKIWQIPLENKEQLLEQYYDVYHTKIQEKINTNQFKLLIDVHDTGNFMMHSDPQHDTLRNQLFPAICISDNDHTTCSKKITLKLAQLFEKHLRITPSINDPYKGGFVTTHYATQIPTLQIEFSRFLYMDEKTQQLDHKKIQHIREQLFTILQELSQHL